MKVTCILALVALLVASAFSASVPLRTSSHKQHTFITEVVRTSNDVSKVGLDNCKMCVEFAGQATSAFLNFILQLEVDTCGDLCEALAEKVGSQAIGFVCDIVCDMVGIKEFINILNKEDIDPIYMCELIPACPINDHGDAKFTDFEVSPKSGPNGVFDIRFQYSSVNGTGTGELSIEVVTLDGIPVGDSVLHELAPAGTYNGDFQLKAEPDPDCDPTQGPCENWGPGEYTVKMAVCNGECGSKHPHSEIYDEATTTFTITESTVV